MTKDEYQKAIPPWCKLRTFDEHYKMMLLCWGVTSGLASKEAHCSGESSDGNPCEFYNPDWRENHG